MSNNAPHPHNQWIKATKSNHGEDCVEMRRQGTRVQVRDSKNTHGPILSFDPHQFTAWLDGASNGEFTALAN